MDSVTSLWKGHQERRKEQELLASLVPHVRSVVHRHAGPDVDLDDALQEAMIEVALALPSFRGQSKLSTFVHTIAMRSAVLSRKRSRRRPRSLDLADPPDARDPERVAVSRQELRELYRALDQLAPQRREAFVLCAIEQLAHEEAAKIAGTSTENLRLRLKRARADLAALIASSERRSR
jgi:RNA polymerase sigma-70 factor, ECF subfamily